MYGHNIWEKRGVVEWEVEEKLNDGIRTKALVSKTLLIFQILKYTCS
jgi:hypothetical protein